MPETTEHRRAIVRRARDALHEGRELPTGLRDTIRHSWLRSRLAAAPIDRITVPYVAEEAGTERLLQIADPVLSHFAQQLAGTPVCLVLADRTGRVAGRWASDRAQLRRLSTVSVEEGFVLAEDLAGTNGVGTALEELAPVTIFGEEHYAESLQELVCIGVPIRHPLTHRLEGVLDLACPIREVNQLLLPTAMNLGAQIERELSTHAPERDRIVFDQFVARSRMTSAALVALSPHYMVTNAAAAELFDLRDQAYLWEQAREALARETAVSRPLPLTGGGTVMVNCIPITTGAAPVGALIEVTSTAEAPRPVRTTPRSPAITARSHAAVQLGRELEQLTRAGATRVLVEGEPGAGKVFTARHVHQLRRLDTTCVVHPATLTRVRGEYAWLGELENLLADKTITVTISNIDLLDDAARRAVGELLAAPELAARLVLATRQIARERTERPPLPFAGWTVVQVPPLRERRDDIAGLVYQELRRHGATARVGNRAMTALINYPWPENFPQLQAEITAAVARSGDRDINCEHLGHEVRTAFQGHRTLTRLERLEREAIADALRQHNGNKVQVAQALGLSRSTLYRRLRQFGLETDRTVI